MSFDHDAIINDAVTEAQASRTSIVVGPELPDATPKGNVETLRKCASTLLAAFQNMKDRPQSRFDFEEIPVGTYDQGNWIMSALNLKTNVVVVKKPAEDLGAFAEPTMGYLAVEIEQGKMTLGINRFDSCSPRGVDDILESVETPSPLARDIAAANLIRKVALQAAMDRKLTA